jgi:hypothetical protein
MDISEFSPFMKPMLVPAVAWTVFLITRRVERRWLRLPIRTVASIAGVIGAAVVILLSLFQIACTKHVSPLKSSDGQYVAVLKFSFQGALGDDYANVNVRRWWSPFAENVYSGLGYWDFKNDKPSEPEVRWLDRSHLLIRYPDPTGNEVLKGLQVCRTRVGDVEIVCQPVP